MANERKWQGPLDHHDIRRLSEANDYAKAGLRRPLNALVTICPSGLEGRPPTEWQDEFRSINNRIAVFSARKLVPFVAIKTRECHPEGHWRGPAPHLHVVMHWPSHRLAELEAFVARNWPAEEGDVTPASGLPRFTPDGRPQTLFTYATKVMTSNAARGYHRQHRFKGRDATGPILGQRATTTRNIAPAVVAHWQEARRLSGYTLRPIHQPPNLEVVA